MKPRTVQLALVVGLAVLLGACSPSSGVGGTAAAQSDALFGPGGTSPIGANTSPLAPIVASQGDLIRDGDLRVMVHGWTELTLLKQPGHKFIAVDFSVVNTGKATIAVFGMHGSWALKGAQGTGLRPTFNLLGVALAAGGILYPGDKVRAALGYDVSDATGPYSLIYDNDRLPSVATLTVALSDTPGITEPPATIGGESTPAVESMGQPVTHGNWQLQVLGMKASLPCKALHSSVNCTNLPDDTLLIRLDLAQKNESSGALSCSAAMFWLEDPTGRHFGGTSTELGGAGKSVAGGSEIRFSADFLVWPGPDQLRLAFRYRYGEKPASGDYALIGLPPVPAA